MADAYGLDDFSLLSGPQQNTARTIQSAFNASQGGLQRGLQRYNLTYANSGPMLAEIMNDTALKRAQTTAGILNQNQQLQNVIDASHATPHGFAANLAAYAPLVGGLSRLYPMLFGTNNSFSQNGLIPSAYQGAKNVVHWFTDPTTGSKVGLDAQGNTVGYSGLPGTPGYDMPSQGTSYSGLPGTPGYDMPSQGTSYSGLPGTPGYDMPSQPMPGIPADLSNWDG